MAEGSSKNSPTKGSLSPRDLDVVEVLAASMTAGWSSARQKRKWRQSGSAKGVVGPSSITSKDVDPSDGVGAFPKAMSLADFLELEGSDINLNINTDYYMVALGEGGIFVEGQTFAESQNQRKQMQDVDLKIDEKYVEFKQFDTVGDHNNHFYSNPRERNVQVVNKPAKDWVKRIQHEWKVLEKDLPEFMRMELLKAVIIGPSGTPYHDGLLFFDVYFPPQYPRNPPLVYIALEVYGLIQISMLVGNLLNTWPGDGCEKWNSSNSTMLQVLVSIQALVLNAKPYFNEPGFENYANTPQAEKKSTTYNEETFLLSCKTMLYSLRNPPKHFDGFIFGHFRNYGHSILMGCKAYMDGAQVGSIIGGGSLKKLFEELMMEFIGIGVDCHEFMVDTTLKV
uniref:UBC core domain-containing protein n=1 Tax=Oryza punctata TaxID=4537 RepID=A0A0E0JME1_ORYPU